MPASINYKNKYIELRTKYIADMDVAFRLGFEAGGQQAQQQQAMDAQAQAQEAEMRMQEAQAAGMNGQGGAGGPPGDEGGGNPMEGGSPEGNAPEGANPMDGGGQPPGGQAPTVAGQPSELDQHIGKLEGMLGSASPEVKKSLQDIISLRKTEKLAYDLKKGDLAIKGIVKALHKPAFKMSVQATHNMNDSAKRAVTLQHKIVNDVFKSWQEEEAKASKDIANILNVEGLLKGE